MPYKDKERQKAAMREISKRYRERRKKEVNNMITRKHALDFVLEKYKEGKLTPEKCIELVEMLYKPKTTLAEAQHKIREATGSPVKILRKSERLG